MRFAYWQTTRAVLVLASASRVMKLIRRLSVVGDHAQAFCSTCTVKADVQGRRVAATAKRKVARSTQLFLR